MALSEPSTEETKVADTRLDRIELTMATHANILRGVQDSVESMRKQVETHTTGIASQIGALQALIPAPLRGPIGQWIVFALVALSLLGNLGNAEGMISHALGK